MGGGGSRAGEGPPPRRRRPARRVGGRLCPPRGGRRSDRAASDLSPRRSDPRPATLHPTTARHSPFLGPASLTASGHRESKAAIKFLCLAAGAGPKTRLCLADGRRGNAHAGPAARTEHATRERPHDEGRPPGGGLRGGEGGSQPPLGVGRRGVARSRDRRSCERGWSDHAVYGSRSSHGGVVRAGSGPRGGLGSGWGGGGGFHVAAVSGSSDRIHVIA